MQDVDFEKRGERFPDNPPMNKEYYLLRSIFEEHFPKKCADDTIPKGLSIACSTPEAIAWDPEWANIHDISGRAVSFHNAADDYQSAPEMSASDSDSNGSGAAAAPREAVSARAAGRQPQRLLPQQQPYVVRPPHLRSQAQLTLRLAQQRIPKLRFL